jgi:diguanylate cyclase (GGDEF)-like protein
MTAGNWGAAALIAGINSIIAKARDAVQSLAFKTMLALAAAALPALAVAAILGSTLITAVSEAEADFEKATSAARRLADIRMLIEKESGLIARLPAELDLRRLHQNASDIADIARRIDATIADLTPNERIISPAVAQEIRLTRADMRTTTAGILDAAQRFAQTTALEQFNGPFEAERNVLVALLDAVRSNIQGIIQEARTDLRESSQRARRLTPIALFGALIAMAFGAWMIRRYFLQPVTQLTDDVLRIRESGQLDVRQDHSMLARTAALASEASGQRGNFLEVRAHSASKDARERAGDTRPERGASARTDEIGSLSRSFDLLIAELAEARKGLIAWSEAEISKQCERLDGVINNMPQGACMYDAEQKLIISNRRYAEIYGLPPELTRPGTSLRDIVEHRVATFEHGADFVTSRLAAVAMGKPWYAVNELPDGRVIAVSHLPLANGCSIGTHEDITERRKAEAQIEFMAHHDVLTRLPNRIRFREQMEAALAGVARGQTVAVLCLDLDHFKAVNDTLGHPVGDALLQAVADRIRACVRPTDSIARLGGDEFAIVQTVAEQPTGSTALAARLIEKLSQPFDVEGHQVVIGASIGIAVAPNDGEGPDCLLKNADMALYRAKGDGRGIHRYFEPEMDARMQARRTLELDLRKAYALGEFELFYQPLVRLDTNQVSGLEALLRWRHPQRGLVRPGEFIPLVEEIGLIGALGAWVLKQACHDAATWPGDLKVAVNLSPIQFKSGTLVLDVIAALGASGLSPGRLELEITEAVLLQDTEATIATLTNLRDLGVSISMDDFGTGYSSLGYLRKFPFDKIKIDGSFIHDLSERPESVAIVRAVAGLGSSLGISTTAEGVETEAQLERLREEGCTEVQGYLFSQPIPAHEVRLLLQRLKPPSKAVA